MHRAALAVLASSQQQHSQQVIRIQEVADVMSMVVHDRTFKTVQSLVIFFDSLSFPSILLVCADLASDAFHLLAGGAAAHQLQPQAQYPTQTAAGLQPHALHPVQHAMAAAPSTQHHTSYQYPQAYAHPQMGSSSGTHAGQMGAMDSVQDTALLQVQAALTDPSKASINMPAQQISAALQQGSRPQAEAAQGVGPAGATASAGAGLQGVAPAAALSGQQHTAGVLNAAGGIASGEGTPAGR